MAATLTADQEALTYFSFPIEKREDTAEINPVDGTPDIWIWGKATDGTIDGDREIVDPEWSAKALMQWADTGANVRMSHDPKRPAGKGHQVHVTSEGHWVKSLICDPLAKHFIRQGVLNDYSVGISNPDFRYGDRKLDPDGKALRVITGKPDGSSRIAELSVVDRGSNFNSRFSVVKSAGGFTGQMVGDEDEIAKAAPAQLVKTAHEEDAPVTVDVPKSASITFSPADLNKLLAHRREAEEREAAELPAFKAAGEGEREILGKKSRSFSAERRRELARQGKALPDGSYPIPDKDALRRAAILARSGHGDVAAARRLIARRAKELGVANPLDDDDKVKDGADKSMPAAVSAAPQTSAVAKDDGGEGPPEPLHRDDGQDDGTDSDADANDKAAAAKKDKAARPAKTPKVPCPKCKAKCKPGARFCGKCGCSMTAEKAGKPTPGEGVTGAAAHDIEPVPAHREPDGPAFEAFEHDAGLPTVPDSSVKTAMHLSSLGIPREHGMLHDLLCPAYTEASVKAAWPGADFSLIDEQAWQAKALEVAATAPLEEAQKASQVWTAARMLKAVTPDLHADIMTEARKAFRDANPGPAKAPEPGEISAERFNRPYLSAGHSAPSPDHGAPHSAPIHPGHIAASDFHRGLITDGHAADSPENAPSRPEPVPAPEVPGVPSRVYYSNTQRANARQAMAQMHDHIAMTFPDLCPMHGPGHMGQPPSHARPVPMGVGGPVPHGASTKSADPQAKKAAKMAKKARKQEKAARARATENAAPAAAPAALDTAVLKAAVLEATAPLAEKLAAQDGTLRKQARDLKRAHKMLDAIAGQPDPAVTAYRGAAITKSSAPAPAGPAGFQQRAALAQESFVNDRIDIARNSPDPGQRLQAMFDLMEVHGLTGTRT